MYIYQSACNNDNIIFQIIISFLDVQSSILSSVSYPFKREGLTIVSSFNSTLAPDRLQQILLFSHVALGLYLFAYRLLVNIHHRTLIRLLLI